MMKSYNYPALAICLYLLYSCAGSSEERKTGSDTAVLPPDAFRHYIEEFNRSGNQDVINHIPDSMAWNWIRNNVPIFECPDKEMEEIYFFRWWTYRKHIRKTPDGFVITEFLPQVSWSKKHNTINCAAGHHFYEGRWIRDHRYMQEYAKFYFGNGGDPGGKSKVYSNWMTDGIWAAYLVNHDSTFITALLDSLIKNHDAWSENGEPENNWQVSRKLPSGLYWQIDSWEGGEFSIGGTGIRPMINSYMYSDAMAVSNIAKLAGRKETAEKYLAEAKQLRNLVQENLWDPQAKFFKTKRDSLVPTDQYDNRAAERCAPGSLVSVREIFGYVPWYFNLPEEGRGYEESWLQLTDPRGFSAPYGPSVAERRHPNFLINRKGCAWSGASWPFSTSQTLTALANLLNNYRQNVMNNKVFFDLMKIYTHSQHFTLNGTLLPWIDESLDPDTGRWIPGTDDFPGRGKDYNHSTYCDIIITGVAGLRPRADNTIEVNPLIPEGTWDYFCLDNVYYHGRNISIIYDRNGSRYGKGKGLIVMADGCIIARNEKLGKITAVLPPDKKQL